MCRAGWGRGPFARHRGGRRPLALAGRRGYGWPVLPGSTPPQQSASIGAVVFDLGGVLVEFDPGALHGVFGARTSAPAWWQFVLHHPAFRGFETGAVGVDEMAAAAVEELCVEGVSAAAFLDALALWPSRIFPGAVEVVREAGRLGVPVVLLSNTNPLHWGLLRGTFEAGFARCFVSYETGVLKPDPRAFALVESALGVGPARLLFFDDNPQNIATACARGWQGVRVGGPPDIAAELARRSVR